MFVTSWVGHFFEYYMVVSSVTKTIRGPSYLFATGVDYEAEYVDMKHTQYFAKRAGKVS